MEFQVFTKNDVIIRTNGGTLSVNDTKNESHQAFFGYAKEATVKTGNSCFEIYGSINSLTISQGKTIVKETGVVADLKACNGTIENNGFIAKNTSGASISGNPVTTEFKITSTEEFESFRNNVNDGFSFEGITVQLATNIRLNDGWTPINGFKGTFDGANHKIINLNSKNNNHFEDDYTFGLFGTLENAVEIKNITFADCNISFSRENGNAILTGFLAGIVKGNVKISGIIVESTCSVNIVSKVTIGGIIGRWKHNSATGDCTIKNCVNSANMILSTPSSAGSLDIKAAGIIGFADMQGGKLKLTIQNCANKGNISASATGNAYSAGMYTYNSLQQRPLLGNRINASYQVLSGDGAAVAYYENNCTNSGTFSSQKSGYLTYMMSGEWADEANSVETSNYKYMVAFQFDKGLGGTYIFDNCSYIGSNTKPL